MWMIQPAVECWFPTKMGQKIPAVSPTKNVAGFFIGDLMAVYRCWDDGAELAKQVGGYYYRLASKP